MMIYVRMHVHMYLFNMPEIVSGENTDLYIIFCLQCFVYSGVCSYYVY